MNIGVLGSRSGTELHALLDACDGGHRELWTCVGIIDDIAPMCRTARHRARPALRAPERA